MAVTFHKETRFVFAGDAITSCGRSDEPENIGNGYVRIIRDFLRAKHAPTAPMVLNRGRSGNTMSEIASRWQEDVIAQKPDVVSILFDAPAPLASGGTAGPLDHFRTVYRQVLEMNRRHLPECKIVLGQSPAVWSDVSTEQDEALRLCAQTVFDLAREYDSEVVVPFHEALVFARRARPDIEWIRQTGQLSSSAHMVFAFTWLEETGLVQRSFS